MKMLIAGILIGVCLIMLLGATYSTFSNIQGRGTYAAGYIVFPRCPSDTSTLEFGAACADAETGDVIVRTAKGNVIVDGNIQ